MHQIKRAQQRIAEQAEVLDIVNDAIYSLDQELHITEWNKAAEHLFGYKAGEVLGKKSELLGSRISAEQREAYIRRALAGDVLRLEVELRRKDGLPVWVDLTGVAQRNGDGKFVRLVAINRDITQRKKAEQALRDAHEQLANHAVQLEKLVQQRTARLNEMVGDLEAFSYSIVHDMRAPLRAMQGFAQFLVDECGPVSDKSRDYVRRIRTAADRMDQLIQDGLNYSRIMRGHLPLAPVDVAALMRGILETYPAFQPPYAEIEIQGAIPPVNGNESALTQCISNLLGNAVKFVAPGVTPKVRAWAETHNSRVRLFFEDNGIGIEKHAHERIFQIFQRLDSKSEGTGIGLAIVKKAIERMRGTVGLKSEPGKGSTFWLELARANPPQLSISAPAQQHALQ